MNQLLDTEELADVLGMRPQSLREMRSEKRGPAYVKVGRLVRYRVEDVNAWLEDQRVDR